VTRLMENFTDAEFKKMCETAMRLDPGGGSPMSQMCAQELRARLAERGPPPVPKITVTVIRP
jgi:hypothetical protein